MSADWALSAPDLRWQDLFPSAAEQTLSLFNADVIVSCLSCGGGCWPSDVQDMPQSRPLPCRRVIPPVKYIRRRHHSGCSAFLARPSTLDFGNPGQLDGLGVCHPWRRPSSCRPRIRRLELRGASHRQISSETCPVNFAAEGQFRFRHRCPANMKTQWRPDL